MGGPKPGTSRLRLLTPREREVALSVAAGLSNQAISNKLSITTHTVKNHLTKVFSKLAVANRLELAVALLGVNADSSHYEG